MGRCTLCVLALASLAWGQERNGRLLWIIPNSRSAPEPRDYRPLTVGEKFGVARRDSLDPGAFLLAGVFAAKGQASDQNPSFGQGAGGFAKRYVASYADWAIVYHLTEGAYPALFRQDPRYFRKGSGGTWTRLKHAVGQTIVARSDSGGRMFNWSEIAGDASAVAISQAYYPDGRTPGTAAGKFGVYVGMTAVSNILKEFWPGGK